MAYVLATVRRRRKNLVSMDSVDDAKEIDTGHANLHPKFFFAILNFFLTPYPTFFVGVIKSIQHTVTLECFNQLQPNLEQGYRLRPRIRLHPLCHLGALW